MLCYVQFKFLFQNPFSNLAPYIYKEKWGTFGTKNEKCRIFKKKNIRPNVF